MDKNFLRFGAEVYTWFMNENGRTHAGKLGHMIEITAQAGFQGIEPIHFWMGDLKDPIKLKDKLDEQKIELAAIALSLNWKEPTSTEDEKREILETIKILQHFPGALLCIVQIPAGRHDLEVRRKQLLKHILDTAKIAADHGVESTFHPNSPPHSIARTREDYDFLLGGLDSKTCGWTPDVGHIINGGMDPLEMMKTYKQLINLVHYKDWDGQPDFVLMGKGKVDFISITDWLVTNNYKGWIICEDEGKEAYDNPDGVTLHDGAWIRENFKK